MKACLLATKTCFTYAFVTQQPFGILNWNFFAAWIISIFHHTCKCTSFDCTPAIKCGNVWHGPHSDTLFSGSERSQFNSPRLVKREAGFPNPRLALIGSNQLWRVNDSPYYREFPLFSSRTPSSENKSASTWLTTRWLLLLPEECKHVCYTSLLSSQLLIHEVAWSPTFKSHAGASQRSRSVLYARLTSAFRAASLKALLNSSIRLAKTSSSMPSTPCNNLNCGIGSFLPNVRKYVMKPVTKDVLILWAHNAGPRQSSQSFALSLTNLKASVSKYDGISPPSRWSLGGKGYNVEFQRQSFPKIPSPIVF